MAGIFEYGFSGSNREINKKISHIFTINMKIHYKYGIYKNKKTMIKS